MMLYEPSKDGYRREVPIDMARCRVQTYEGVSRTFHQCARKKLVEVDGVGYCKQHSPEETAKRRAVQDDKYAEEKRKMEFRGVRPGEYRDALRQIAAGDNNPRALARAILEKWGEAE